MNEMIHEMRGKLKCQHDTTAYWLIDICMFAGFLFACAHPKAESKYLGILLKF